MVLALTDDVSAQEDHEQVAPTDSALPQQNDEDASLDLNSDKLCAEKEKLLEDSYYYFDPKKSPCVRRRRSVTKDKVWDHMVGVGDDEVDANTKESKRQEKHITKEEKLFRREMSSDDKHLSAAYKVARKADGFGRQAWELANMNSKNAHVGIGESHDADTKATKADKEADAAEEEAEEDEQRSHFAKRTSDTSDQKTKVAIKEAGKAMEEGAVAVDKAASTAPFAKRALKRADGAAKKAMGVMTDAKKALHNIGEESRNVARLGAELGKSLSVEKRLSAIIKVLEAQSNFNTKTTNQLKKHQEASEKILNAGVGNVKTLDFTLKMTDQLQEAVQKQTANIDHKNKALAVMQKKLKKSLGETSNLALGTESSRVKMQFLQDQMDRVLQATTALSSGMTTQQQKMLKFDRQMAKTTVNLDKRTQTLDRTRRTMKKEDEVIEEQMHTNEVQSKQIASNLERTEAQDLKRQKLAHGALTSSNDAVSNELTVSNGETVKGYGEADALKSTNADIGEHVKETDSQMEQTALMNVELEKDEKVLKSQHSSIQREQVEVDNETKVIEKAEKRLEKEGKVNRTNAAMMIVIICVLAGGLGFVGHKTYKELYAGEEEANKVKIAQAEAEAAELAQEASMRAANPFAMGQ